MPTLAESFSDDQIISHLCKERVKQADSRNDRQYVARLIGDMPETDPDSQLYQLLPRRRQWAAFRPRNRKAGINPDLTSLQNAVRALRHRSQTQPWVGNLNRFIAAIRTRVLAGHAFEFIPPLINWQIKKGHEYRALCQFTLADNLILCLFARYLRDALDSRFSSSSYAFRVRRGGRAPTHHDALNAVYDLKHNSPTRDLFVAECDIRGFFDTVDHGVALAAFRQAAVGADLDIRADQIFRAYLNCYSFPVNVLGEAGPRLRQRDEDGYFPWPLKALHKHHTDLMTVRIGVPQGGAISGVIANLILDAADKCVERQREIQTAEIHYYRYCDDMILLSPVKKDCRAVFQAYLHELDILKLPYHTPERTVVYGKKHWDNKSKAPYRWSGKQWFGCVPWLQFVGYQVRYDGLMRPKPDSAKKEVKKLKKKTSELKYRLRMASQERPILATKDQAMASLKHKLVAQGVGRIKGGEIGPRPMCWAAGFKALHNKPFVPGALRLLDRTRLKQIGKFALAQIRYGLGRNSRGGGARNPVGYAFSYNAQFVNAGGQNLILNPWRPHNYIDTAKQFIFLLLTGLFLKKLGKYMRFKLR